MDWNLVQTILSAACIRTVFLWGRPGIGKTFAAYKYGRTGAGVYALTLTEETPAAEIRGHYLFRGNNAEWHDGPAVRAMREGARLVLNEISHASADVMSFLHPILESAETARVTLPTGETVTAAPGFHVVVTDNCSVSDLPLAIRDRFDACVHVTEPHPEACAQFGDLAEFARIAASVDSERAVSLRQIDAFQRLRAVEGVSETQAAKLVWCDLAADVLVSMRAHRAPDSE